MTYFEIEKDILNGIMQSIKNGVSIVSGKEIVTVKGMSNVPESTRSYCAIDIINKGQFGYPDIGTRNINGKNEHVLHRTISLQLGFIGDESDLIAGAYEMALVSDHRVRDEMRSRGFGVLNNSRVRRAPKLRDNMEWVEGWNMDVTLTIAVKVKYEYDWIEYITLNGELLKIPYKE